MNIFNKTATFTTEGGRPLKATIPGYVWMYPGNNVDVDISEDGGAITAIRVKGETPAAEMKTEEDVERALKSAFLRGGPYRFLDCTTSGCKGSRLDSPDSNRCAQIKVKKGTGWMGTNHAVDKTKPLCEACFLALLNAEMAQSNEKENQRQARAEVKLYAKGFRFAVDMWIHPKAGGDDYQTTLYFKDPPTAKEIVAFLAKRSVRTDDYAPSRELKPMAEVTKKARRTA